MHIVDIGWVNMRALTLVFNEPKFTRLISEHESDCSWPSWFPIFDIFISRRLSLFGHIARMPDERKQMQNRS